MRHESEPELASYKEAIAWMDAPQRRRGSWRAEGLLVSIDELVRRHGLEVVCTTYQGDNYFTIERLARDLSASWHNARHDSTDCMSLAVPFEDWMARDVVVLGPGGEEWVIRDLDRIVYIVAGIPNLDPSAVLKLMRREALKVGVVPPVITTRVAQGVLDAWWEKATHDHNGHGFPKEVEYDAEEHAIDRKKAVEAMHEALLEQMPL